MSLVAGTNARKNLAVRSSAKPSFARRLEWVYKNLCLVCVLVSAATTLGIVLILARETGQFFAHPAVTVSEFFFGREWAPGFAGDQQAFGVLPLVNGTLMIMVGAMLIAVPLGLLSAIFLTQYASPVLRKVIKPIIELLAGVPTVVYGYFGLMYVTPLLRNVIPDLSVYNALAGMIVVGIMVLPMVTTLCDDALSTVPKALKEGGLALGATSFEVTKGILVRAALSGIIASFILAMSRAVGETMAVSLAAGQSPVMTLDPRDSIETMTAYIARVSKGDTPAGSVEYLSLYAVGALLFTITMGLNILARYVVKRFRFAN